MEEERAVTYKTATGQVPGTARRGQNHGNMYTGSRQHMQNRSAEAQLPANVPMQRPAPAASPQEASQSMSGGKSLEKQKISYYGKSIVAANPSVWEGLELQLDLSPPTESATLHLGTFGTRHIGMGVKAAAPWHTICGQIICSTARRLHPHLVA